MLLIENLDTDWLFRRDEEGRFREEVSLPHSPFISDLDGNEHWFGTCEYIRSLRVDSRFVGMRIVLRLGGAMQRTAVYLDGEWVGEHKGGFLPFEIDLSGYTIIGETHELRVEISNRRDPDIPPGKRFEELDFCWYGGLYRDAALVAYPESRIESNLRGGENEQGGVLVQTLALEESKALLKVTVWAKLKIGEKSSDWGLRVSVARSGRESAQFEGFYRRSDWREGPGGGFEFEFEIENPRLWSVSHPHMYDCRVDLVHAGNSQVDSVQTRFGIRRIGFSRSEGFTLNGESFRLRGVNRHQEYPYVGYAVPPAAQYRDAVRIKEAGFDYVRLSHYPQCSSFLDACDELGIVVMNCIPGWQFQGGAAFDRACEENARVMLRRDRNHPSIVLWELSLNETEMSDAFVQSMEKIAREELPGDQTFTCGWVDGFDVYLRSRQHGSLREWQNGDKASVVAEYGDWEFYACNAGFDQSSREGLMDEAYNSRKLRGEGTRGLLQQASNHMVAHNDNRNSPAAMDGLWAMFDHARGYHEQRATMGVMDIFRLPKFSYYFFRSQRGPKEFGENWSGGPMVFIAYQFDGYRCPDLWVFSNCDEVEVYCNGVSLERRKPTIISTTQFLERKPFVFPLPDWKIDSLQAFGYVDGKMAANHRVQRSGEADSLSLEMDERGVEVDLMNSDLLFVHARALDAAGSLCVASEGVVHFRLEGEGEFASGADVGIWEAGIASILVRVHRGATRLRVLASMGPGLEAELEIVREARDFEEVVLEQRNIIL